jgi:hypothetical protein
MRRKQQRFRPYFEVGHQIQLQPDTKLHAFVSNYLKGLRGTIMRIEQRPSPKIFEVETQEDWQEFLRVRRVYFWVKLDDFPELHDYYKQNEVMFLYHELRPLSPKMSRQQLAQYCQGRLVKEQNKYKQDAYYQIMRYFNGQRPNWPLSDLMEYSLPEKGHDIDLINRFISVAAKIRRLAQEGSSAREIFEAQSQVCEEVANKLMPKQRSLATLNRLSPMGIAHG